MKITCKIFSIFDQNFSWNKKNYSVDQFFFLPCQYLDDICIYLLQWCSARDSFGLQIPVTTGRFEL